MDSTSQGLIVAVSAQSTEPLEQLLALCGWPVLLNADRRGLSQHLELHMPACTLFWLDEPHDAAPARSLIAWLRERGPRPYCIVLAYRLDPCFEPAFRAVGVQSYLPVCGNVPQVVEEALWPLLNRERRQTAAPSQAAAASPHRRPRKLGKFHDLNRPP